ncbi:MAG: hypothetical protein KA220_07765 [Phenylobacterium sp.]|nr:hypothetical protein [Phenylobacterium sp.]MBP8246004.1 hypothetical protein [Phenylobacterium sp.]
MSAPTSEPATAAIACVEAFTAAFNARDVLGMDALLHFPHVILADENLIIWTAPGQLSPTYFDELAAAGWGASTYHDKQVVLAGDRKVHLLLDYSRDRPDGTQISRHHNLWIVTWQDGRWGIKQRSY